MPSLLEAGELKLTVPLVESLPGAADVSVVRVHVTLGGNLTYYERRHGKMVPYKPKSVMLPKTCPRGGFKFSATFSFQDGTGRKLSGLLRARGGGGKDLRSGLAQRISSRMGVGSAYSTSASSLSVEITSLDCSSGIPSAL